MEPRLRRTPCVGICSTTYGDLVCRGCKRYSHEITGWNGFDDDQRELVWVRLNRLLLESVQIHLDLADAGRLHEAAAAENIPDRHLLPAPVLAFQLLRLRATLTPHEIGLVVRPPRERTATDLVRAIDLEFLQRSRAHYERSFKVTTER